MSIQEKTPLNGSSVPVLKPPLTLEDEDDNDTGQDSKPLINSDEDRGTSKCYNCVSAIKNSWFVAEAVALIWLALPISLMFVFEQVVIVLSVVFVGHISEDPTDLDAAALGNSFFNVTGFALIFGMTYGADTLCAQSYGYKNYKRVGIILQRGLLIIALACFPVVVIWLNSESILLLLQQPPCVVRLTGQYMQFLILALPGLVVYVMLQSYLRAQSLVWIFVVIGLVQVLAAAGMLAVFVYIAKLGVLGAALGLVVSYNVPPIVLIAYIWIRGLHKETWGGWSWESLNEWWQFLKLAIPSFLTLSIEWWTFEISVLVTGSVSETQQAVNTVIIQMVALLFFIPFGLGTAVSVRIGNELGAGNPRTAKKAAFTSVITQAFIAVLVLATILSLKNYLPKAFTKDEEVVEITSHAIYGASGVFLFDQIQGTLSGVIRGLGLQALGTVTNFIAFYIIGLPIGIFLVKWAKMGALGMWIGLSIASCCQAALYLIIVVSVNWQKQSDKAIKLASEEEEEKNAPSEEKELLSKENHDSDKKSKTRTRLRLLLTKGSFVVIGVVVIAVGAVLAALFQHDELDLECEDLGVIGSSSIFMPEPTRTLSISMEPMYTPLPTLAPAPAPSRFMM